MAQNRAKEIKKQKNAPKKLVCPICGFYSLGGDYCPICEIVMSCQPMIERRFLFR